MVLERIVTLRVNAYVTSLQIGVETLPWGI